MELANLLSGVVGAVLVFLLTVAYGEIQRVLLRRRERHALLRLLVMAPTAQGLALWTSVEVLLSIVDEGFAG